MNDYAVIFQNVSLQIGKDLILDRINLKTKSVEITGILGPNGAGKSSLLSLINGLRTQSSGEIRILGEKLPGESRKLRKKIGVVFQETALYEELTTFENLNFCASLFALKNPKKRIEEVLDLLKLSSRSNQVVRTLSGGLRRRVTIARALLHDPELLIIDEPTLGVDIEARHDIWSHLRLLKSKGRSIIAATNYLDEAQALCDQVAVLQEGRLIALEHPDRLVDRTGFCLDIECEEKSSQIINKALTNKDSVIKIDKTPSGLSIFLKSNTVPKQIMTVILQNTTVKGFRVRAPDLSEVFKILRKKYAPSP